MITLLEGERKTLYPALRCTFTVRIFLAKYCEVPCISPFPKSAANCALASVEKFILLPAGVPIPTTIS